MWCFIDSKFIVRLLSGFCVQEYAYILPYLQFHAKFDQYLATDLKYVQGFMDKKGLQLYLSLKGMKSCKFYKIPHRQFWSRLSHNIFLNVYWCLDKLFYYSHTWIFKLKFSKHPVWNLPKFMKGRSFMTSRSPSMVWWH